MMTQTDLSRARLVIAVYRRRTFLGMARVRVGGIDTAGLRIIACILHQRAVFSLYPSRVGDLHFRTVFVRAELGEWRASA